MSRPILHQANEIAGFPQMVNNLLGHGDILPFIAPTNIVDLARFTSKENLLNRRAMVLHG
jgi:hypothetical protein